MFMHRVVGTSGRVGLLSLKHHEVGRTGRRRAICLTQDKGMLPAGDLAVVCDSWMRSNSNIRVQYSAVVVEKGGRERERERER